MRLHSHSWGNLSHFGCLGKPLETFACTIPNMSHACFLPPCSFKGTALQIKHGTSSSCGRTIGNGLSMKLSVDRVSLYSGIGALAGILGNRLLLTPLDNLAMTQSRSDILGIIAGATLVLYGVGKAEVVERKEAVEMDGIDVRRGFSSGDRLSDEIEWAAQAIIEGVPNIKSFLWVERGKGKYFLGRFRDGNITVTTVDEGVIETAITADRRAYLADMKVVPVRESEFGFLPAKCQVRYVKRFCF